MVNASLNWASIVGIVLAVCGAGLYFLRSFKPALARDYDVFFAAIGLLCGGILFFQGWRLDPILQFGQFLLAGTTVFFAYESVRLRGVATDQARRSSYFDDEPDPARMPGGDGLRGGWDDSYEQFEEARPLNRRFTGREDPTEQSLQEDFYRPRRTARSRAAIPEQAASRSLRSRTNDSGSWKEESDQARRMARFGEREEETNANSFGQRRNLRQEQRRGSRPSVNQKVSSRGRNVNEESDVSRTSSTRGSGGYSPSIRSGGNQGAPIRDKAEDATYTSSRTRQSRAKGNDRSTLNRSSRFSSDSQADSSSPNSRRRDNSSRFDD
ncbi:MAG: hypothetical protein CMG34_07480 [Candidatus Marinimicrobia bacterium]|nr:hypothetical protein [Candidatus Neomarinimicrobiota bacterium]